MGYRRIVLLMTLALLPLVEGSPAQAARKPPRANLTVAALTISATSALPGSAVTVTATTKNTGKRKARASTTRILLSGDGRASADDLVLASLPVPALRKRKAKALGRTVTLPATSGSFQVLACADAGRRVKETKEGDNCRATGLTLRARPAPPTPPPGLAAYPGPSGVFPRPADPAAVSVTSAGSKLTGRFYWSTDPIQTWSPGIPGDTQVELRMPRGTFLDETRLSAQPVTLTGAPFGVVAAFDLQASGFLPERPISVVFGNLSVADPVVFLADADGSNLRLAPVGANPGGGYAATTLTALVSRPGIVGVASAGSGQVAALDGHQPAGTTAQWEAALGKAGHDRRLAQLTPPAGRLVPAAASAGFEEQLIAYFNDAVVPAVNAAYADPELTQAAVRALTSWQRSVELLGMTAAPPFDILMAAASTAFQDLLYRYADHLARQCRAGGGWDAYRRGLGHVRTLALLGWDAKADELMAALTGCGDFSLELTQGWSSTFTETFDHTVYTNDGTTAISYNHTDWTGVEGGVMTARVDLQGTGLSPQVPVEPTSYTGTIASSANGWGSGIDGPHTEFSCSRSATFAPVGDGTLRAQLTKGFQLGTTESGHAPPIEVLVLYTIGGQTMSSGSVCTANRDLSNGWALRHPVLNQLGVLNGGYTQLAGTLTLEDTGGMAYRYDWEGEWPETPATSGPVWNGMQTVTVTLKPTV